MLIHHSDTLLTTDSLTVSEMLATSPDKTTQGMHLYATKMKALSEHNVILFKARYERMQIQFTRQVNNATYWGMAIDLMKEQLIEETDDRVDMEGSQ